MIDTLYGTPDVNQDAHFIIPKTQENNSKIIRFFDYIFFTIIYIIYKLNIQRNNNEVY